MKKLLFPALLVILAVSCSDDSSSGACGVGNPVEDLAWLKADIAEWEANPGGATKFFYVEQGTFGFSTVFIYSNCCPYCSTFVPIYNCEGETLKISLTAVKDRRVIWHPADFECAI